MNARPLFPVHTGVAAYEKAQAASIGAHFPKLEAADVDDRPMAGDEVVIEKELTSSVLSALKSCQWGTRVAAYSLSQRRVIETTQEIEDVVIEQILNHDGARVHLIAWLASEAGAAAALCIATGHAGANATGLMQARNGGAL